MRRHFAAAAILSVLVLPASASGEVSAAALENCRVNAEIAQRIADLRKDRTPRRRVLALMTEGENPVTGKYANALPQQIDLIYSLPRADLKRDIRASFEASCVALARAKAGG